MPRTPDLDGYDRKILRHIAADGRITWRDLAEKIGLSLTPTIRRVRRLEQTGYIAGYSARLDERLLVGTMSVFVSVTLERQVRAALTAFEERLEVLPEVMGAFLMSGDADYLLRCVVGDVAHYRQLLDTLTSIPGVAHIQSSFALKTVINRAAPLID